MIPTVIFFSNSDFEILIPVVTFLSLAFIISFQHFFFSFSNSTTIPNNLPFFFLERTCQISMYSNLPTLKIHIHIYSIKPTKYQCKIHIHIYRCILPNINVFNLPTLMIHTHTYRTCQFFLERTCQISIYSNLLILKIHIHTYIHIYIYIYICNLPNINVLNVPT